MPALVHRRRPSFQSFTARPGQRPEIKAERPKSAPAIREGGLQHDSKKHGPGGPAVSFEGRNWAKTQNVLERLKVLGPPPWDQVRPGLCTSTWRGERPLPPVVPGRLRRGRGRRGCMSAPGRRPQRGPRRAYGRHGGDPTMRCAGRRTWLITTGVIGAGARPKSASPGKFLVKGESFRV